MTISYTSSTNPKFANELNTSIELTVKFDHLPFPVQFIASPSDLELHGQELYSRAVAGDFGQILPFTPNEAVPIIAQPNIAAQIAAIEAQLAALKAQI